MKRFPAGFEIDEGVYYNKYMSGNKIKMSAPLSDGLVEYSDGTESTTAQMAKDVTTFLVWASPNHTLNLNIEWVSKLLFI